MDDDGATTYPDDGATMYGDTETVFDDTATTVYGDSATPTVYGDSATPDHHSIQPAQPMYQNHASHPQPTQYSTHAPQPSSFTNTYRRADSGPHSDDGVGPLKRAPAEGHVRESKSWGDSEYNRHSRSFGGSSGLRYGAYNGNGLWNVTPRRDYQKALSMGTSVAHTQLHQQRESLHWQRKLDRLAHGRPISAPVGQYPITASAVAAAHGPMGPTMALQPTWNPAADRPASVGMPGNASFRHSTYGNGQPAYGALGQAPRPSHTMEMNSALPPSVKPISNEAASNEQDEGYASDDDSQAPETARTETSCKSQQTKMTQGNGGMGKWLIMTAAIVACLVGATVFTKFEFVQDFFGDGASQSKGSSYPTPTPTPYFSYDDDGSGYGWMWTRRLG